MLQLSGSEVARFRGQKYSAAKFCFYFSRSFAMRQKQADSFEIWAIKVAKRKACLSFKSGKKSHKNVPLYLWNTGLETGLVTHTHTPPTHPPPLETILEACFT